MPFDPAPPRLHLCLLIDAQHHRRIRRVQTQPDDITDLVNELRIGEQLEVLDPMRLQPERPPDPRHRCHDHLLDDLIGGLSWLTRSRLIDQTVQPLLANRVRHLPTVTGLHSSFFAIC